MSRFLALLILIVGLAGNIAQAGAIHPSLFGPSRLVLEGDSVDVWVYFTDRGFTDPGQLQQALVQAEREMLPANKTRRLKVRAQQLVEVRDLPLNTDYVRAVLQRGARYRTVSRYVNALSARVPRSHLEEIAAFPFVKEIKPVAKGRRDLPAVGWGLPESSTPPHQWDNRLDYGPSYNQLNQIHVIAAHDSGYSGAGVLVCLLDTGFFTNHEALITRPVLAEWDFINNDPETANQPGDPSGQHDHGTYTFSTLGGAHDGDLYGPAYGATFIIGKTESVAFEQPIEEDWYVAGLEWADSLGAEVISTSLGYLDWYTFSDLDGNTCVTTIGVDQAVANGIVCVTAAGNERQTSWGHIIAPADADSVLACGAVDNQGVIASFSSPGPSYDGRTKPEVCARGVNTWCAVPSGSSPTTHYGGVGGTSLSTPLVGGSCALILEAHPTWTPMMLRTAVLATASNHLTPNNDYGWGLIDVMAAIQYNFPPFIQQRHPNSGTFVLYPGDLQDFWVTAEEPEGESVTYTWWVDAAPVAVVQFTDSVFILQADSPGTKTIKVVVEDERGGVDSTSWIVEVQAATGLETSSVRGIPAAFALYSNFPNPFNPSTAIRYQMPDARLVSLNVYDTAGRLVQTLVDGWQEAGVHRATFDGSGLPSGIYFVKLVARGQTQVQKIVLTK